MYTKVISLAVFTAMVLPSVASASVFDNKIIGLDAGHNDTDVGATGECIRNGVSEGLVYEVDVNRSVREELTKLIAATSSINSVYQIQQLDKRSDRVADAEANNSDILISIHHNGSTNTNANYTQFFVTQKNDKELANAIYPFMLDAIGITGRGIKSDGYGMTVYGSLPGVLTESYFITNTDEACKYVDYVANPLDTTTRVHQEAQALFDGLVAYFSGTSGSTDGGGSKGGGKGRNR